MLCCLAHNDAYKANVLHRDISPGNIIIDASGGGWLIDWDLSKLVSTPHLETPRTTMRTVSNKSTNLSSHYDSL